MMSRVTLKVFVEAHRRLLEIVSKLQLKEGRRISMDEAIRWLIDHAEL